MQYQPPFLISWNITKRCNLKCRHCYLDASELEGGSELTTLEAKKVVDEIASLNRHSMLILTGGEPLLREDCLEIAGHAAGQGITVVLGTNGTLLDRETVRRIVKSGVKGVGVSIDSSSPLYHDRFRGLPGAWQKTASGIDVLGEQGVEFSIHLTVTKDNIDEIARVIEYAIEKKAKTVNIFFLVCTGRGHDMVDVTPRQYEQCLKFLLEAGRLYEDRIMVRARCAPHFLRLAHDADPDGPLVKGATSGCIAGTGYLRITPEGDVTPCPYMPTLAGNIKATGLKKIWEGADIFKTLRAKKYVGRCEECEYSEICGGCRARALSTTSNVMGEDRWCEYEPKGPKGKPPLLSHKQADVVWTKEAEERLSKVPSFLRSMVKGGVERYAREKGLASITPDILAELKKRTGRPPS